ncbi:MAG: hypothetical protein RLZZ207_410 [Bacteroidota bacterium]|jgi:hypothetical protein
MADSPEKVVLKKYYTTIEVGPWVCLNFFETNFKQVNL